MKKVTAALAILGLTLCHSLSAQEQRAFEIARQQGQPGTAANAAAFSGEVSRERSEEGQRTAENIDQRYTENLAQMLNQFDVLIWNGTRVPEGQFMDAVAVTGNGDLCSGTLVAASVVLTAAHCICKHIDSQVWFGSSIRERSKAFPVAVSRSTTFVPCDTSDISARDIGLLVMERPMQDIAPRRIAARELIESAPLVRAVGFGRTENTALEPKGIKRQVDILIQSHACAAPMDPEQFGCSPPELVARQPLQSYDTCGGDSGGPIYVMEPNSREFLLVGATSRAISTEGSRECGDGGIYTVVADPMYQQFLKENGVSVP